MGRRPEQISTARTRAGSVRATRASAPSRASARSTSALCRSSSKHRSAVLANRAHQKRNRSVKGKIAGAVVALAALAAVPALAQSQGGPTPAARYAVDKTPIGVIWADPKGREVLLKELPPIEMYLDMIKEMTLVQVAPQS